MRINNNIMAMNTHRQLGMANNMGARSMERLSSGYRINRAGDDAAGLAISEKMRAQIRGLSQASRNSQDAISMIQTAEGALQESQSILQRMRELSVQAASDTNTSDDRKEIQKEINELVDEIDRIANTTEFNAKKLLDGSLDEETSDNSTEVAQKSYVLKTAGIDLNGGNLTVTGAANSITLVYDGEEIELNGLTTHTYDGTAGDGMEDFAKDLQSLIDANETLAGHVTVEGVDVSNAIATLEFNSDKSLEVQAADSNSITLSQAGLSAGDSSFEELYEIQGSSFDYATALDVNGGGVTINYNGQDVSLTLTDVAYDGSTAALSVGSFAEDLQNAIDSNTTLEGHMAVYNDNGKIRITSDKEFKVTNSSMTNFTSIGLASGTEGVLIEDEIDETTSEQSVGKAAVMQIGANAGQTLSISMAKMDATSLGEINGDTTETGEAHYNYSIKGDVLTGNVDVTTSTNSFKVVYDGSEYDITDLTVQAYTYTDEDDMASFVEDVQSKIDEIDDLEGNVTVEFNSGSIVFSADKDFTIETADANPLDLSTEIGITSGSNAVEEKYKLEGEEVVTFAETVTAGSDMTFTYNGTSVTLNLSGTDYSAAANDLEDFVGDLNDLINANTTLKGHVSVGLENNKVVFVSDKEFSIDSENGAAELADFGFTANQDAVIQEKTVDTTTSDDLTVASLKVSNVDSGEGGVLSSEDATSAIDVIDLALKQVSAERAKLGAYQNRLEHTINNLDTSAENLTAAESRIRDVDMAKEMMTFTKNNILTQAAQAMLAQANQAPQGVLQLLR